MNYNVKKSENCFSNAQSYEYQLPIENRVFLQFLQSFSIKKSEKLRRPTFMATDLSGVQVKGILKEDIIKVSFPDTSWEVLKMEFEQFLGSLEVPDE